MYVAGVGRWLAWVCLVLVVLFCAEAMLKLLHPPAGDDVSLAQLALPNPEADTCVAWDNVAIVTEHMNRAQLRELQRQVCPELPLPYAEDDGN